MQFMTPLNKPVSTSVQVKSNISFLEIVCLFVEMSCTDVILSDVYVFFRSVSSPRALFWQKNPHAVCCASMWQEDQTVAISEPMINLMLLISVDSFELNNCIFYQKNKCKAFVVTSLVNSAQMERDNAITRDYIYSCESVCVLEVRDESDRNQCHC